LPVCNALYGRLTEGAGFRPCPFRFERSTICLMAAMEQIQAMQVQALLQNKIESGKKV